MVPPLGAGGSAREAALERAIACGAAWVGVNNRDLATFKGGMETAERLARQVRETGRVLVSESGIRRRADVRRLLDVCVDAILVGESLLESGEVAGRTAEFKQA